MAVASGSAALVLSLDLAADAFAAARQTADVRRLGGALARHGARATWGLPLGVNLAELADVPGELAWLADASWAGADVGRGRFATELAARGRAAAAVGAAVDTLALWGVARPPHLDVAAKYGIRNLRGDAGGGPRRSGIELLRYGHRLVGVTLSLAAGRTSWWASRTQLAIAAVERAIRSGGVCHLHAEVAQRTGLSILERVLEYASRRTAAGVLRIETVGELAARLARPRVVRAPARSILRAA